MSLDCVVLMGGCGARGASAIAASAALRPTPSRRCEYVPCVIATAVPQTFGDDLDGDASGEHERCCFVPQVMQTDLTQPGFSR